MLEVVCSVMMDGVVCLVGDGGGVSKAVTVVTTVWWCVEHSRS